MNQSEEKTLSILAYVLGWFVSWIAPLVIYLVYKDRSKFVAFHALQAVYLQGAIFVLGLVMFVFSVVTVGIGLLVAVPVMAVAVIGGLIATVMGAVKANEAVLYELPVIGQMVKSSVKP